MKSQKIWPSKSTKSSQTAKMKKMQMNKIIWLRISVVLSLAFTAVIVGYGSYYFINRSQYKLERENYSSVTNSLEISVTSGIERQRDALDIVGNTYSYLYPNASQWPYVAVSMDYYDQISSSVISTANLRTIAFAPIVTPEQIPQFEEFAYAFLNESGHSELGISPFGEGIYAKYANGTRYHDVQGTLAHNRTVLVPILEIGDLPHNAAAIMFNLRSEEKRIDALDSGIDCVLAGGSPRNCTTITGIVHLVQDLEFRPANLITRPITVPDSTMPVGFTSLTQNWDVILSNSVADYVSGIVAVLCTESMECYTFEYVHGKAIYRGLGDDHDVRYNDRRHSFRATPYAGTEVFTLYLYPSNTWMDLFINRSLSSALCAVTVLIIFFTSAIFFLYDFLMNREATEKELISSTKRQFVKFMSHEIRTPLNIVHLGLKVMYSEMFQYIVREKAKQSGDSAAVVQLNDWLSLINDMESSSDTAIVVLNDLINYDKIDTGTLNIEKEQVNMWDVISTNVNPFVVQARHNGIHFDMDIHTRRANVSPQERSEMRKLLVIGDSVKLGQVIRNLVSNALKFTPSGGNVIITADYCPNGMPDVKSVDPTNTAIEYERAGSIRIWVKDTGAGLSKDNQMKLFSEGMQFNVNQLQAGQGSGLGLWITKGVVQLHNGIISAKSDGENMGCVFTVELPLVKLKGEASLSEEPNGKLYEETSLKMNLLSSVSNRAQIHSILVVDDSTMNRKMVCRLLRTAGYTCAEAVDGQECVDYIVRCESGQQDRVHLILMDYEMPRMNGPTAASVLRDMGCKVPVIGITGNVLAEDKEYFKEHGVVEVLTKPLTLSQLETTIKELNSRLPHEYFETTNIDQVNNDSVVQSGRKVENQFIAPAAALSLPFTELSALPGNEA
jgi:signal transduction histidine kinase/DNA-binding response OmpR family regulator